MNRIMVNETITGDNAFVGYEYKDVTVKNDLVSVYTDGYTNFGWVLEGTSHPMQKVGVVTLKLKRDRKICNKAELTRLQRQFDACANEMDKVTPLIDGKYDEIYEICEKANDLLFKENYKNTKGENAMK